MRFCLHDPETGIRLRVSCRVARLFLWVVEGALIPSSTVQFIQFTPPQSLNEWTQVGTTSYLSVTDTVDGNGDVVDPAGGISGSRQVFAPTYFIEGSVGSVQVPFWIPCYLNPGSEYLVQINGLPAGVSQAERADELANLGMTTVAAWNSTLAIGVRATPRWPELGESAIPGFRSAFQATPLSS